MNGEKYEKNSINTLLPRTKQPVCTIFALFGLSDGLISAEKS